MIENSYCQPPPHTGIQNIETYLTFSMMVPHWWGLQSPVYASQQYLIPPKKLKQQHEANNHIDLTVTKTNIK